MNDLVNYVNDDRLIGLLQKMVQIKSTSGSEAELGQYMAQYLKNIGMETHLQEVQPHRFNVIAEIKGKGAGESLLYNGHIDTNPVGLGWTVDPYAGLVDDEFIYGIGVSNMKSSDAAFVEAVNAIVDSGEKNRGDIKISLVIGELEGGIGTIKMLESGMRADWFINGEPTDLSLMTMHAGSVLFAIDVFGISRHMSKDFEGINAIVKANKVIEALQNFNFSGAANEEHASLNKLNVGVIRGGLGQDYIETRVPQLPDYCTIKIACRYSPSQSIESVRNDLQQLLDDLSASDPQMKTSLRVLREPSMGPFEVDKESKIVQVLRKHHLELVGVEPQIGAVFPYRYYGTDAGHLMKYGLQGIVYGSGGKYNTMPDEKVSLADIKNLARIYTLAVNDICI